MATSQLHEDFSREEEVKAGTDRGFGLVFAGFFAIVAALRGGAAATCGTTRCRWRRCSCSWR